jgi:hypothetical protein
MEVKPTRNEEEGSGEVNNCSHTPELRKMK